MGGGNSKDDKVIKQDNIKAAAAAQPQREPTRQPQTFEVFEGKPINSRAPQSLKRNDSTEIQDDMRPSAIAKQTKMQ